MLSIIPIVRSALSFWISFNKEAFGAEQLISTNKGGSYNSQGQYLVKDSSVSPYPNRFVLYTLLNNIANSAALPTFSGNMPGTHTVSTSTFITLTGTGSNYLSLGLVKGSMLYIDNKRYVVGATVSSNTSITLMYSEGDISNKLGAVPFGSNLPFLGSISITGGVLTGGGDYTRLNISVGTKIITDRAVHTVVAVTSATTITVTSSPSGDVSTQSGFLFIPVLDTGITATTNTLYHIAIGINPYYKTLGVGYYSPTIAYSFSINNQPFYIIPNTSLASNFTFISIGWTNVNFNLFDLVAKQSDQLFTFTEVQQLYNGGQGLALDNISRTLLTTSNIYFIIGDFLVSRNPLSTFSFNNNATANSTSNRSERGYYINDGWFQYTLNGKSLPKSYYDDAANRQPYRNGNAVIVKSNFPEVNTLQNYFYEGVSYINVIDIDNSALSPSTFVNYSGSSLKELILNRITFAYLSLTLNNTFCKSITVSNSTNLFLRINDVSKVDTTITITSCSIKFIGFGVITLNSYTLGSLIISSSSFISVGLQDAFFDNTPILFSYSIISITSFTGYFYFTQSFSDYINLTSFIITPSSIGTGGFGLAQQTRPFNFTNSKSLTTINITSYNFTSVILPNSSTLTTLRIIADSGFTTINTTNVIDGKITLPLTNTITTLLINGTSCTSINRIPTSVTLLDLRNNVYLQNLSSGTIDLSGLANDITISGGIYLSGCSFLNITLPSSRNIAYFDISGIAANGALPAASNRWIYGSGIPVGCTFVSGTGTVFKANDVIWNSWTSLPFGTRIVCNSITIGGTIYPVGNTSFLYSSIYNLYSNYTGFSSSAQKSFSFSNEVGGGITIPTGYVQANATTAGNDGDLLNMLDSDLVKIRKVAYVLVNQNIDFTTTKKYNWSVTL